MEKYGIRIDRNRYAELAINENDIKLRIDDGYSIKNYDVIPANKKKEKDKKSTK